MECTEGQLLDAVHAAFAEALNAKGPGAGGKDGWFTARDVAERTGMGVKTVRERLRVLIAAGRVDVGQVSVQRIDGKPALAPGYRLRVAG